MKYKENKIALRKDSINFIENNQPKNEINNDLIQKTENAYRNKEYQLALEGYSTLIAQDPENPNLCAKQFYCLFNIEGYGFFEICYGVLNNLLHEEPENQTVIFTLASLYYDLNNIEQSMIQLSKLLSINNDHEEGRILWNKALSKKLALFENEESNIYEQASFNKHGFSFQ